MPTTIRDLAPELASRVLFFLELEEEQSRQGHPYLCAHPKSFLPQYATVSRQWQHAVERVTFSSVTLKSTELAYFNRNFPPSAAQSPSSLTVQSDELNSALNVLIQSPNLVSVNLQGPICISPNLFRLPSAHQPELSTSKDLETECIFPGRKSNTSMSTSI